VIVGDEALCSTKRIAPFTATSVGAFRKWIEEQLKF